MIAVAATSTDLPIAEEFFELFKTPWEPAIQGRRYDVVLHARGGEGLDAALILAYGAAETAVDRKAAGGARGVDGPAVVRLGESTFPIYGRVATFGAADSTTTLRSDGSAVDYRHLSAAGTVWRIGYDLFDEIRYLLTDGQPASQASVATLELHIALLRHLLLESGRAVVEIPPRPEGSDFICCLTHDVDFFGVRRHKFDRTLAGFAGRASLQTFSDLVRRRLSPAQAWRNWRALLSLPLVFLNVLPDFWQPFDDYARAEDASRSTFFLIPFKRRPGVAPDGSVAAARAVPYEINDIRGEAGRVAAAGSELGVHGIDAWRDANAGRAEMNELTAVTGRPSAGVRMHWLYFTHESPRQLEAAGFEYDSSWGYNDAVGYRAGTSQVFRLPDTDTLMELPLAIMDSALFYRRRMNLSAPDAWQCCRHLIEQAKCFGGTLVINWHDRSLAPERLWDQFYQRLLQELSGGHHAWFATARQAVAWFRWRRSFRFTIHAQSGSLTVHGSPPPPDCPAARLRITRPPARTGAAVDEFCLDGRTPLTLDL
jgi:hypothetical protein